MKQGILFFDEESSRYDFCYNDGRQLYKGLHCGECMEVNLNDVWVQTRIEMGVGGKWYLVGLPGLILDGLKIRMG